jgi:DNA-binding NtrC family response regulator
MARVLVADDDPFIARILEDRLAALGHDVVIATDGAEALARAEDADIILLDLEMPALGGLEVLEALRARGSQAAVIVITAHGDVDKAVRAMKAGAYDFVAKPFEARHLELIIARALERQRLRGDVATLKHELSDLHAWVRGADASMQKVAAVVDKIAPTQATVLLRGETGTGKEVVARAIHARSPRAAHPFVAVNCAVLKEELLESELFGHEKGAFTGAVRARPGRLEVAAGGTLFLDEIGELPVGLQAKLLRVLQEREYERVGSDRPRRADVRILAATNRDLEKAIAAGTFREDVYYRLKVIALDLPPLRDRPGDLEPLARALLARHAQAAGRRSPELSADALAALRAWSWPGNVRELSNVMERCVLLGGDPIERGDLPDELQVMPADGDPAAASESLDAIFSLPYAGAITEARRRVVMEALKRAGGHQTRAAQALGLTQPYLSRLMKSLGVRE